MPVRHVTVLGYQPIGEIAVLGEVTVAHLRVVGDGRVGGGGAVLCQVAVDNVGELTEVPVGEVSVFLQVAGSGGLVLGQMGGCGAVLGRHDVMMSGMVLTVTGRPPVPRCNLDIRF